jgi:chemotaxis protein MotB
MEKTHRIGGKSMRRKKSKIHEEEHPNSERYLITYADLITLLLGLFVILYSTSQVDASKYKVVSNAFEDYFQDSKAKKPASGSDGVLPGNKGIPQPILPAEKEKNLDKINQELENSLDKEIRMGGIIIQRSAQGIVVQLSEKLLFASGKAELQPDALIVLDSLAEILSKVEKQISVEGHTDSIPIRTFQYESNWHLSSARALSVGYFLLTHGVQKQYFTMTGRADTRPVESNITDAGRARNRRVEIIISDLPATVPSTQGYISPDSLEKIRNNKGL